MHPINDQLAALQRMAVFAAGLRGHELGAWRVSAGLALANCIHCGREVRVYSSLVQPDVEGRCLQDPCVKSAAEAA